MAPGDIPLCHRRRGVLAAVADRDKLQAPRGRLPKFSMEQIVLVKKWKFEPDGKPASVQVTVEVSFRLY